MKFKHHNGNDDRDYTVRERFESIAPHLRAGQLVVLESTTYPGTTEEVMIPILEKGNRNGLKAARDEAAANSFFVAFSPEREDPGNQTVARRDIPKVVGGFVTIPTLGLTIQEF